MTMVSSHAPKCCGVTDKLVTARARSDITSGGAPLRIYYLSKGAQISIEGDFGAAPFGKGLNVWQEFSRSFNLDRVRTPMILWTTEDVSGLWDRYAGLRRLGKPVECWYLPDGDHDVFKVEERMLMGQLLADWFRFWLKDEEDVASATAEQFARWRTLREQHKLQLAPATERTKP